MKQRRPLVRWLGVALIALATSACMSLTDPMDREGEFREQQRNFSQYVRWGNFQGAAAFLKEDQRGDFLALAPELSDVRFTDYEIMTFEMRDNSHATVNVLYTGYRLSSPTSRPMLLRQEWERDGGDSWHVKIDLEPMRAALGLAAK